MNEIIGMIIVAALGLVGSLAGTYFANSKASAMMAYRIEKLEEQVNKHNNIVERTYRLEEISSLHEEKIRVANHRIEDLEKKG